MDPDPAAPQLSRISTHWTVICQAHDGPGDAVQAAQQELLQRYGKAVHRYLLGALRDVHAADELTQEFALRFLRGDLRGADPQRGRFRNYLKGVLFHLVADHRRRRQAQPLPDGHDPAAPPEPSDPDQEFLASWRDELLNRAWKALARIEQQTGQPFHTVLHFRAAHVEMRSGEIAQQLVGLMGKPLTADWVRQTLHRARDKFADLLLAEVLHTLDTPTAEELEQELIDLGLLEYCRPALERFRGRS